MEENKNIELSATEYFEELKSKKQTIDDEGLLKVYDNCLDLINKYQITGQKKAIKKLMFLLESIEKEREIVKLGINTFVYRSDVEQYIDNITKDVVKIIELENYEREIPDELLDTIAAVKNKFDQLYVVFTDYTGKIEKEVIKERDPILFGTFQDRSNRVVVDRFYYIADWEDEYCHLTLEKMVNEIKKSKNKNITRTISTPEDIHELKEQLGLLKESNNGTYLITSLEVDNSPKKKSVFTNIKSAIKGVLK